jgi:hypothetical protein
MLQDIGYTQELCRKTKLKIGQIKVRSIKMENNHNKKAMHSQIVNKKYSSGSWRLRNAENLRMRVRLVQDSAVAGLHTRIIERRLTSIGECVARFS